MCVEEIKFLHDKTRFCILRRRGLNHVWSKLLKYQFNFFFFFAHKFQISKIMPKKIITKKNYQNMNT